jgi:hypothetical protein
MKIRDKEIYVEAIKSKDLTQKDKKKLEDIRVKEFGEKNKKDFKKDYEPNTLWIIVRKKGKIVSFGGIRPIKVKLNSKKYDLGGICSTISVEKGKGYGKLMVSFMIDYSIRTGKTIWGFTGLNNLPIFEKCNLRTKKNFIKKFVWIKLNGEKVYDNDGHGIYYQGRDNLIDKINKSKSKAKIFVEFW